MEKIMSKTNDTSDFGRATLEDHGTLADSELDAVSGGFFAGHVKQLLANSEPFPKDPYRGASFRIDMSGIERGGF
jgi:hypothetical protein